MTESQRRVSPRRLFIVVALALAATGGIAAIGERSAGAVNPFEGATPATTSESAFVASTSAFYHQNGRTWS